jgi:serine/threonine protein kinase
MVERFHTEARAASALNHPNCVRVYDFGETHDGRPYMVMELLKGEDLESLLERDREPPVARVLDIVLQVLSALEEAHAMGIVHRDLKPANVVVLPQRGGGELVKVVDFGLAKLRTSESSGQGMVLGTPEYIAPEQAMAKGTDARTDLYACGIMLYEMVAGRRPFQAEDPNALLRLHAFQAPEPLARIAPERAAFGLDDVVHRAIAKEPADRYQAATEFADALREIVAQRTGESRHSDARSWIRPSRRTCSSCGNPMLVTARFCGECGTVQSDSPPNSVRTPPPPVDAKPSAKAPPRESSPIPPPLAGEGTNGATARAKTVDASPFAKAARNTRTPSPARLAAATRPEGRAARGPEARGAELRGAELRGAEADGASRSALRTIQSAIDEAETSGDTSSAMVFLEQIAVARMKRGEPLAAVVALRRGIELARRDLDRGELDDPIRVVAIFSSKLGDALVASGDLSGALRAYKDALALSRESTERAHLYRELARVAHEQGHEGDALAYRDSALREESRASDPTRRGSRPPRAD